MKTQHLLFFFLLYFIFFYFLFSGKILTKHSIQSINNFLVNAKALKGTIAESRVKPIIEVMQLQQQYTAQHGATLHMVHNSQVVTWSRRSWSYRVVHTHFGLYTCQLQYATSTRFITLRMNTIYSFVKHVKNSRGKSKQNIFAIIVQVAGQWLEDKVIQIISGLVRTWNLKHLE